MEIAFDTGRLAKLCNSEKKLRGKYGNRMAKVIQRRLLDLAAADTLETRRTLPGRCHELKGDRAGQLAVDLVHPERLIFRPDHDPVPMNPGGGLDWTQVTRIIVVEIINYHKE